MKCMILQRKREDEDECSYIEDTPSLYNLPTYQKDYNTLETERERG